MSSLLVVVSAAVSDAVGVVEVVVVFVDVCVVVVAADVVVVDVVLDMLQVDVVVDVVV